MASIPVSSALATIGAGGASFSLQLTGIEDLQRLARLFSASGLFGRAGDPNQHMAECAIKILAGAEAGFGPFASHSGVTVINGKPGFGANLLAQAIKRHPVYDYRVLEKTDTTCRIRFLAGKEELGIETFTMEMARRAGLLAEKTERRGISPWKAYPEAMLFARCLTAGMRTHCPDALGGMGAYTPEELGATGPIDENGAVVAVTVTEQAPQGPTRDQLQTQALSHLKDAGIRPAGIRAMLSELGGPGVTMLGQLDDKVLSRLASAGASAETVQRWNAAGGPEAAPAKPVTADADHLDHFGGDPDPDEQDDPDDLPAAWTFPADAAAA